MQFVFKDTPEEHVEDGLYLGRYPGLNRARLIRVSTSEGGDKIASLDSFGTMFHREQPFCELFSQLRWVLCGPVNEPEEFWGNTFWEEGELVCQQ